MPGMPAQGAAADKVDEQKHAENEKIDQAKAEKEKSDDAAKEQADEDARHAKARKKTQRDKELSALKRTPKYQAQKWLLGVTKLISQCSEKSDVAKKSKKLPAGTDKIYFAKLQKHSEQLQELEKDIRSLLSKPKELKLKLGIGHELVEKVKDDLKSFNLIWRGCYKESK